MGAWGRAGQLLRDRERRRRRWGRAELGPQVAAWADGRAPHPGLSQNLPCFPCPRLESYSHNSSLGSKRIQASFS